MTLHGGEQTRTWVEGVRGKLERKAVHVARGSRVGAWLGSSLFGPAIGLGFGLKMGRWWASKKNHVGFGPWAPKQKQNSTIIEQHNYKTK